MTLPEGWNKEGMAQVQRLGYSVAGVHNLRPTSRDWTPAQLVEHTLTLTPYVIDPRLIGREELYAQGSGDAIGFEPSARLYAERGKSLKAAKANLIHHLKSQVGWRIGRGRLGIHQRAMEPVTPLKGETYSPVAKT